MKELEKIREALEAARNLCGNHKKIEDGFEALSTLASLEAAGEGDEDGQTVKKVLELGRELCETNYGIACFSESEAALSRLVLRAKLTDKERVKIKRETLESLPRCEVCGGTGTATGTDVDSEGQPYPVLVQCSMCYTSGYDPTKVKEFVDRQLAELDSEKKEDAR